MVNSAKRTKKPKTVAPKMGYDKLTRLLNAGIALSKGRR